MLVEVLLPLQSMPSDGHSVIRGIKDVCVVKLTHVLQLLQYAGHLTIDVLGAGKLPPDLVPYGALVAPFPYPADRDLVAQTRVTMVKGMLGQPVER